VFRSLKIPKRVSAVKMYKNTLQGAAENFVSNIFHHNFLLKQVFDSKFCMQVVQVLLLASMPAIKPLD